MRRLLMALVLFAAAIGCLGFYQGWFRLSTAGTDQKPSATITVDKDKIHADEEIAKEKVQELGHKAKEKAGDLTAEVKP